MAPRALAWSQAREAWPTPGQQQAAGSWWVVLLLVGARVVGRKEPLPLMAAGREFVRWEFVRWEFARWEFARPTLAWPTLAWRA